MGVLPRVLLWRRLDTAGAEHLVFDDRNGLFARGVQVAVDPVPYACRYELLTDPDWATVRFEATAEGAGWLRTVHMERAAERWRVTTAEQGDLDRALHAAGHPGAPLAGIEDPDELGAAIDIDLGGSPLTNTLPLRRLGRRQSTFEVTVAWVLPPSLVVEPAVQTYTVLGPNRVRYQAGSFTADLDLDADGYVVDYPGLAARGT